MPVGGCAGASGGLNNGDRKSMVHSENVLLSGRWELDFVIEFVLGVAFFFRSDSHSEACQKSKAALIEVFDD